MQPACKLPHIAPQPLHGLAEYAERNLNFEYTEDGQGFLLAGPDVSVLERLDRFVWLALDTTSPPFQIAKRMRRTSTFERGADGRHHSVSAHIQVKTPTPNSSNSVAGALANFINTFRLAASLSDTTCPAAAKLQYAPHIQLLIEELRGHPFGKCLCAPIHEPTDNTGRIVAEVYNDFVTQFRRSMLKRKFLRRELHNWRLGSRENQANLRAYLDGMFIRNECLTILHIRLFHAKERANLVASPAEAQVRDLTALRESRTRFFDRMRKKPSLFPDAPGRVWSVMPSLHGGYDLHVTLLFNSAALQRAIEDHEVALKSAGLPPVDFTDRIGRYWVEMATRGLGDYRRVDHDKWLYGGNWVHGEVRAEDVARRERLAQTLGYLAMRRALVRLKCEPPGEYFGMCERRARMPRRARLGGAILA